MFIVDEADRVRAKHTTGIQRTPLSRLRIGPLNRAISPKYMHALWENNTLGKEGFSRARYIRAIGLQPDLYCTLVFFHPCLFAGHPDWPPSVSI